MRLPNYETFIRIGVALTTSLIYFVGTFFFTMAMIFSKPGALQLDRISVNPADGPLLLQAVLGHPNFGVAIVVSLLSAVVGPGIYGRTVERGRGKLPKVKRKSRQ